MTNQVTTPHLTNRSWSGSLLSPAMAHQPKNATDYVVPVAKDVSITCPLYVRDRELATILYFHGNGEVVADHDYLAPLFNFLNLNLFVADPRGLGIFPVRRTQAWWRMPTPFSTPSRGY